VTDIWIHNYEPCGNCAFRRIVNSKKDILTFEDNIECPVCLETKRGVTNINCDHCVCVDCFREMHRYIEDGEGHLFHMMKLLRKIMIIILINMKMILLSTRG